MAAHLYKVGIFHLVVLLFSTPAFATGGVGVPNSYLIGPSVAGPGNMQFRMNLNQLITVGSDRCSIFYFEGTESSAAQKYETFMAAFLSGKNIGFTVDQTNPANANFCHITEVSIY